MAHAHAQVDIGNVNVRWNFFVWISCHSSGGGACSCVMSLVMEIISKIPVPILWPNNATLACDSQVILNCQSLHYHLILIIFAHISSHNDYSNKKSHIQ